MTVFATHFLAIQALIGFEVQLWPGHVVCLKEGELLNQGTIH